MWINNFNGNPIYLGIALKKRYPKQVEILHRELSKNVTTNNKNVKLVLIQPPPAELHNSWCLISF